MSNRSKQKSPVIQPKVNSLRFLWLVDRRTKDNHRIGAFACDCGKVIDKTISRVASGYVKTCGSKVHAKGANRIHGMRGTSEYTIWQGIKQRCLNKKNKDYPKYGKLGMEKSFSENFMEFYSHVGKRPSKNHSIDRIDNTKGYFKGNIQWRDKSDQQSNKSTSKNVFVKGQSFKSYAEAGRHFKVSLQTVKRWCIGYVDKRRAGTKSNGILKKKEGCISELKYQKI